LGWLLGLLLFCKVGEVRLRGLGPLELGMLEACAPLPTGPREDASDVTFDLYCPTTSQYVVVRWKKRTSFASQTFPSSILFWDKDAEEGTGEGPEAAKHVSLVSKDVLKGTSTFTSNWLYQSSSKGSSVDIVHYIQPCPTHHVWNTLVAGCFCFIDKPAWPHRALEKSTAQ